MGSIGKLFFLELVLAQTVAGSTQKDSFACFVLLLVPAVAYAPHTGGKNKLQN